MAFHHLPALSGELIIAAGPGRDHSKRPLHGIWRFGTGHVDFYGAHPDFRIHSQSSTRLERHGANKWSFPKCCDPLIVTLLNGTFVCGQIVNYKMKTGQALGPAPFPALAEANCLLSRLANSAAEF